MSFDKEEAHPGGKRLDTLGFRSCTSSVNSLKGVT